MLSIFVSLSLPGRLGAGEMGITGLVIDQTRSRVGQEFYENFYRKWMSLPASFRDGYNIVVGEFYNPKYGFVLSVKVDGTLVYQSFTMPRSEEIEERAKEAIGAVIDYIIGVQNGREKR